MTLPLEGWGYADGALVRPDGSVAVEVDERLNPGVCVALSRVGEMLSAPTVSGNSITIKFKTGDEVFQIVRAEESVEITSMVQDAQAALSALTGKSVSLINTVLFLKAMRKFIKQVAR